MIEEVLSASTEAYDRGDKFAMYRLSPSLQDYVLISANKVAIDIYNKDDRSKWDIINYRSGDLVELASINLSFSLAEPLRMRIKQIYEDIIFDIEE